MGAHRPTTNDSDREIARYREVSPGLRREFVLFPGKVFIRGRQIGGNHFEVYVPLQEISADFGWVHIRARRFYHGFMLFAGLCALLWIFLGPFALPIQSARVIITALFAAACAVWCVVYFSKYRVFQFVNRGGLIALHCVEAEPERDRCREFVETISRTIREAQSHPEAAG